MGTDPPVSPDDIAAFLDARTLDPAVIVARSMGTTIAQRFAVEHPERVRELVLLGRVHSWRSLDGAEDLRAMLQMRADPIDPGFGREFPLGPIVQPLRL